MLMRTAVMLVSLLLTVACLGAGGEKEPAPLGESKVILELDPEELPSCREQG